MRTELHTKLTIRQRINRWFKVSWCSIWNHKNLILIERYEMDKTKIKGKFICSGCSHVFIEVTKINNRIIW